MRRKRGFGESRSPGFRAGKATLVRHPQHTKPWLKGAPPIVGKSAEAKERHLVPEVIEDFFLQAAPVTGIEVSEQGKGQHMYRVSRVPPSSLAHRRLGYAGPSLF
jgi:hypothetical protein